MRYNFLLVPLTTFRDAIPILDVREIDRAIAYYVERLGFEVAFRSEDDPKNYAGVSRGSVHLDMQWQHEDHFKNGTAGNLRVRIVVDDPDSLFEEYRLKGIVGEVNRVRNTSWGTGEFGFRDLDGNGLVFYRAI